LNKIAVIVNDESKKYPLDQKLFLKYNTSISDVKLSQHEKFLAIALAPSSDQTPKIEMYIYLMNLFLIYPLNNQI
jgi:hypothetical protein